MYWLMKGFSYSKEEPLDYFQHNKPRTKQSDGKDILKLQ